MSEVIERLLVFSCDLRELTRDMRESDSLFLWSSDNRAYLSSFFVLSWSHRVLLLESRTFALTQNLVLKCLSVFRIHTLASSKVYEVKMANTTILVDADSKDGVAPATLCLRRLPAAIFSVFFTKLENEERFLKCLNKDLLQILDTCFPIWFFIKF